MRTPNWKIVAPSGVAFILALSLYLVFADAKPLPHAGIQMSRIDFLDTVDAADVIAIKQTVMQQPGVKHCFFNPEAGLLTFGYDLQVQDKEYVLARVVENHPYKAELFHVTTEMAGSSCPVTGANSPVKKLTAAIQGLIN